MNNYLNIKKVMNDFPIIIENNAFNWLSQFFEKEFYIFYNFNSFLSKIKRITTRICPTWTSQISLTIWKLVEEVVNGEKTSGGQTF